MCESMVDIQSVTENRRGKKERKKEDETSVAKYNGRPIGWP